MLSFCFSTSHVLLELLLFGGMHANSNSAYITLHIITFEIVNIFQNISIDLEYLSSMLPEYFLNFDKRLQYRMLLKENSVFKYFHVKIKHAKIPYYDTWGIVFG